MEINVVETTVLVDVIDDSVVIDNLSSSVNTIVEIIDAGMQGPPGSPISSYIFTQPTSALVWNINHNLGFIPSIDCFSSGGLPIEGSVVNLNNNQLTVTWNYPTEGSARLN